MLDGSDSSIIDSSQMMFEVENQGELNRSLEQEQLASIEEEELPLRIASSSSNNSQVPREEPNDDQYDCEINAEDCEEYVG